MSLHPPEATFDICDPLPTGTTLLEASAGTGKTWTIAALVTRYVAEGVTTLEQMLVVTFSRAASQELRARVRLALVNAEQLLQDPPTTHSPTGQDDPQRTPDQWSGDALDWLLLAGSQQERAERLRRIRRALADFDAATIATTHQFCQMVLRSLGVAGDTDSNARLVDDVDDLLVEVVDDLYLKGFVRDSERPVFTRAQALAIARAVVDDSHATVVPTDAPPGSVGDRRSRFAHAVRRELDRRKRRQGVLHYQDLLSQLASALADDASPARERMRQRWQVVLVDEFQDTDPVQWQVLDRAFTGHATMVLIGDPKQAIYAFRGGDIATYLEAAATATARQTLGTNFRSDAPLVASLQRVLGGAELGDPAITVGSVQAHHSQSRLQGAPENAPWRLRVMHREHAGQPGARSLRVETVRHHVAQDAAADIATLIASDATHEGQPLLPAHIAVLSHRGDDLARMQRALADVNIPAVLAAGGSVFHTLAAQHWLALLEALDAPHRSGLVRAAALTSLMGHTAEDLDNGGDDLMNTLTTHARDLAELVQARGVAAVLELATVQGLTTRVLGTIGGERHLTDLRHIGQLLHDVGVRESMGLAALIEWLRGQMVDGAPFGARARTRRLDSDASAVQLMTIHGSKGLQFPVVYLPFATDRYLGKKDPSVPLFHDPTSRGERCRDVGGSTSPGWDASVVAHRNEDAGESLRLLYVALTRAQSQLVTWWAPGGNAPPSALHRLLVGRAPGEVEAPKAFRVPKDEEAVLALTRWKADGESGTPGIHLEMADIVAPPPPPARASQPTLAVRQFTRTLDTAWRRTSYTALTSRHEGTAATAADRPGADSEPEVDVKSDEPDVAETASADDVAATAVTTDGTHPHEPDEAPEPAAAFAMPSPMATLPVGATFGSLVHAVLEHADPAAGDLRAELLAHVQEQLTWWPVDLGPQGAQTLAHALEQVCLTPLGPLAPGATLRTVGQHDRLCELDFEMPLAGGDDARAQVGADQQVRLGQLRPLLLEHLAPGDPVRGWADALARPELADQPLRGYLTGSVDVVLRTQDRYFVVDYKSNWLGPLETSLTAGHYRRQALNEAMGHSSYPLQALLYAVVAHRFLRWRLSDYDPHRHLGGVLYLYLRGMCGPQTPLDDGHPCGVFSWQPPLALVEGVSDLLDGSEA